VTMIDNVFNQPNLILKLFRAQTYGRI
jgi:hypothetical protein